MKVSTGTVITVLLAVFILGIGTVSVILGQKKLKEEQLALQQLRDDFNITLTERNLLADSLRILRQEGKKLEASAAQASLDYNNLLKYTRRIEEKHRRLIDSISNIPPDTAYHELQSVFPTHQPLLFPFSGEQVSLIYTDVISLTLAHQELTLQKQLTDKCNQVTSSQQDIISNLHYQNNLLMKNGELADIQINSLQRRLDLAAKNNKRQSVGNKVFKTAAAAEFIYIVVQTFRK